MRAAIREPVAALTGLLVAAGFCLSFFGQGTFGSLGWLQTAATGAMVLAMLLALWFSLLDRVAIPGDGLSRAVLLFWGAILVSILLSNAPGVSLSRAASLSFFPMAFLVAWLMSPYPRFMHYLLSGLLGWLLVLLGVSLQQLASDVPYRGFFLNVNNHAAVLLLLSWPLLALSFVAFRQRRRVGGSLLLLCYSLTLYTVFASNSRGALVAFGCAVGVGVLMMVGQGRWQQLARLLPMVIVTTSLVLIAGHLLLDVTVIERLFAHASLQGALADRLPIWQAAMEMWRQQPWTGVGLGLFYLVYPAYRVAADAGSAGTFAHNDALQFAAEGGVLLALPLLLLVVIGAWTVWRAWQVSRQEPRHALLSITLCAALAGLLVQTQFSFHFSISAIGLLAGIGLGMLNGLASPPRAHDGARSLMEARVALTVLLTLLAGYAGLNTIAGVAFERAVQNRSLIPAAEVDALLSRAARLAPWSDVTHLVRAERLASRLLASRQATVSVRDVERALTLLDQAIAANPYRAATYLLKARLVQLDSRNHGQQRYARVMALYQEALQRKPQQDEIRNTYANYLLRSQQVAAAARVYATGFSVSRNSNNRFRFGLQAYRLFVESGDLEGLSRIKPQLLASVDTQAAAGTMNRAALASLMTDLERRAGVSSTGQ